ncbi:hypothetical protein [Yersinia wautersii]|uniref:hypothetical protein n=1 Tax=Yersinia wautersii TaxID=1341643 RepID=UPI00192E4F5B|nr:hypothetical protein [Yersinia wautersii]
MRFKQRYFLAVAVAVAVVDNIDSGFPADFGLALFFMPHNFPIGKPVNQYRRFLATTVMMKTILMTKVSDDQSTCRLKYLLIKVTAEGGCHAGNRSGNSQ